MPTYQPYPTAKDTPSRKTRKGARAKVFQFNKKIVKLARKERRLSRGE